MAYFILEASHQNVKMIAGLGFFHASSLTAVYGLCLLSSTITRKSILRIKEILTKWNEILLGNSKNSFYPWPDAQKCLGKLEMADFS